MPERLPQGTSESEEIKIKTLEEIVKGLKLFAQEQVTGPEFSFDGIEFKKLLNDKISELQDWSDNFSSPDRETSLAKGKIMLYIEMRNRIQDIGAGEDNWNRAKSNIEDNLNALYDIADNTPELADEINQFISEFLGESMGD
jgi:hypothetical protein